MQIKTTMRDHHMHIRMTKILQQWWPQKSVRMQRNWITHVLLWKCKMASLLWKTIWQILKKLNTQVNNDCPIEMKTSFPNSWNAQSIEMENKLVKGVKEEGEALERKGCGYAKAGEGSCGGGNVPHLHCIHVHLLLVIVYYSFVRCFHWEKLNKMHPESLCIISYKCTLSLQYFRT